MARSEILLGRNPEDLRERVLFLIKCSEREAQAISYRCDGFFEWCGLSDLVPEDMSKGKKSSSNGNNPTKLEQAMEFLEKRLSDGPVLVTQLLEEAEKMCPPINEKTLRRAKKLLGLQKDRKSVGNEGDGKWFRILNQDELQEVQDQEGGDKFVRLAGNPRLY